MHCVFTSCVRLSLFFFFFFFNDTATTEIYTYCHTLSLHDALPIYRRSGLRPRRLLIRRLIRNAASEDPARGVGGVAPTYVVRCARVAGPRGASSLGRVPHSGCTRYVGATIPAALSPPLDSQLRPSAHPPRRQIVSRYVYFSV